jgi:hypothetical protein
MAPGIVLSAQKINPIDLRRPTRPEESTEIHRLTNESALIFAEFGVTLSQPQAGARL